MSLTALTGASIVLPDRVLDQGTLVVSGDQIVEITPGEYLALPGETLLDVAGHYVVPGFIDVHVHGVQGVDVLDGTAPIAEVARRLARFGVTAFCPTTVACDPSALRAVLEAVATAREAPDPLSARVLGAHLESNFVNPAYRGAQPHDCLRHPPANPESVAAASDGPRAHGYSGEDILAEIRRAGPGVGIVTLAPELDGAAALIETLALAGVMVSLGHSGATYAQGMAGIDAGARHATHLFNRMPPLHHREPGLVAAVLDREEVTAELVCDGFHVDPVMLRTAIRAKGAERVVAITDGTSGSGLPRGSRASLGGRPITVGDTALLDDGTLAGSVLTMDRAFKNLVDVVGVSILHAARMCAANQADELRLGRQGRLEAGALADFVVLDHQWQVAQTWIGGRLAFSRA